MPPDAPRRRYRDPARKDAAASRRGLVRGRARPRGGAGTVLDNDAPAPPDLIAWHEAKSSIKAPPEAKNWKLSELNLFFLSGGTFAPP